MAKQDFYDVLGISKSASQAEIKKGYRKMAIKYHPDKNPDDKSAEENFKKEEEAYEILSDENKKARYDQYGHQAFDGPQGGGGFGGGLGGGDAGDAKLRQQQEYAAALEQQRHERAQVRRDHRDHIEDHPLRVVARVAQHLDGAEALGDVLHALLGARGLQLLTELLGNHAEVEGPEDLLDGLGPHVGVELGAVLGSGGAELLLGEELELLHGRVTGIHDHVVLEVDDPLEVRDLAAEQVAEAARHGLEEPDVRRGRGQVDVAHPLPTHAAVGDHHAALVAHDALVLDALVLTAGALPVLLRTEDALAEQPVTLGPVGAVVDGLGLLDLSVRPGPDVLR